MSRQADLSTDLAWPTVAETLQQRLDQLLMPPVGSSDVGEILAKLKVPAESKHIVPNADALRIPLNTPERTLYQLQRENTYQALRKCAQLTREIAECSTHLKQLLSWAREATDFSRQYECLNAARAVRCHRAELRDGFDAIAQESPEAFYVVHSRQFRKYARQLNRGEIARLPATEAAIDEMLEALCNGQMVIVYGPTGSGKTEVAQIVGRSFSEKEPVFIRGHRDLSSRDLVGTDVLKSSDTTLPTHIPGRIAEACERYQRDNPTLSTEQLKLAFDQITHRILQGNPVTVSEFQLGGLALALYEGRTGVIDEFDLIPRNVLMGANSWMTKRPGDQAFIPESNLPHFTVPCGYGVILTANFNTGRGTQYLDRERQDASTYNRARLIQYGFLPQTTEGAVADAAAEDKQLYQLILATLRGARPTASSNDVATRIEDRAIVVNLPGGTQSLDSLWRLAKFAAITQMALEGKASAESPYGYTVDGVTCAAQVNHALTPRVIVKLLEQWRDSAFEYELDHYIYRALVDGVERESDKDYFYRQGQMQGFFLSPGWPVVIDDGTDRIYSEVVSPKNQSTAPLIPVPGRILIEEIYGKAPERVQWPSELAPEAAYADEQANAVRVIQYLEEIETLQQELQKLRDLTDAVAVSQE